MTRASFWHSDENVFSLNDHIAIRPFLDHMLL